MEQREIRYLLELELVNSIAWSEVVAGKFHIARTETCLLTSFSSGNMGFPCSEWSCRREIPYCKNWN